MKKVKGLIYDFILAHNSDTKWKTLYYCISKVRKVYEFTEKIEIDKIKYIKTYNVNFITELSDSQIQIIVDYFSKNSNIELPDDQNISNIDFKEEILGNQTNILEAVSVEVNISTTLIFLTHVSNSSDDFSRISPVAVNTLSMPQVRSSKKSKLPISILLDDPKKK
jgi:hypothetical protein